MTVPPPQQADGTHATANVTWAARTRETANNVKQGCTKNRAFFIFLLNPARFTLLPHKSDLWQSGLHW